MKYYNNILLKTWFLITTKMPRLFIHPFIYETQNVLLFNNVNTELDLNIQNFTHKYYAPSIQGWICIAVL